MSEPLYDYLVVGAGFYGATFAWKMKQAGKRVLVVEKRNHVAGNAYTETMHGIEVHMYGAHIFHTSDREVWKLVNQFAEFNRYTNSPVASYKGRLYNLPFNMNTFYQLWGVRTPDEARRKIEEQRAPYAHIAHPANLEEQALTLAGPDLYETLIKGYSEKQWGKKAAGIPAYVLTRVPFRFTFDNNYFSDPFQGIPVGGFTNLVARMLDGIEVRLETDYLAAKDEYRKLARKVVYTGQIDQYFDYCYGALEYRSLRFEHEHLPGTDDYQGNAVFNYTEAEIPYTRIVEHKHFEFGKQPGTVITREFPDHWTKGGEAFYPVGSDRSRELYARYEALARQQEGVIFGGRLGEYRYYDMDKTVACALAKVREELNS